MKGKATWKSKTFWVNIIAVVALVAQNRWGYVIDGEGQAALLLVVNMVLRACTSEPLSWPKGNAKSGFTRLRLLVVVALLSLSVLALGCSQQAIPRQPGETIATAAIALDALMKSTEVASRAGLIDDEQFLSLFDKLTKAHFQLEAAGDAHAKGDPIAAWAYIDRVLSWIAQIRKAVPDA